jgi:hypothetical protein
VSHRPHAYASVKVPTHAGNPPNTFVPAITAEVRLYWTPTSTRDEIVTALEQAFDDVYRQINAQPETYGQPVLQVGVDIDSVGLPIAKVLAEEAAAAEAAPSTDEGWVRARRPES